MTRSRLLPALPALVLSLVLAPSAFAAKGFSYGVAAGDVTATSAILWGKANQSGKYTLQVAGQRRGRPPLLERLVRAKAGNDNTLQAEVEKLDPGTRYVYRFVGKGGRRSAAGAFRTAPRPNANDTIEFAWTGDTDFLPQKGETKPYWNNGGIFRRMRAEGNHFNIHLGDTIYSDTEVEAPAQRSLPGGPDGGPEVGQVQAQPRQPLSASACAARRASTRTGTTTSSSTTSRRARTPSRT